MQKMLLFFDIDGTLFDDDRHLPDSVRPAMEAAQRNGHQLIINTGRTLCNMDHRLDCLPLDGWIMGAPCGLFRQYDVCRLYRRYGVIGRFGRGDKCCYGRRRQ